MITPVQIVIFVVQHINFGAVFEVTMVNQGRVGLVIVITVLL